MPSSVLYICCPSAERRQTEKLLRDVGFVPRWAEDSAAALDALEQRPSVVLADFADPRSARIVHDVRRRRPATFLLAIADNSRPGILDEIERAGLPVVLHRPLNERMLTLLFAGALAGGSQGDAAAADLRRQPIFAESSGMRAALEAVARVAGQRTGVLICGDSGTGRRMLAREIHERGDRASKPFIEVDCAEGSAEELEQRIFGTQDDAHNGGSERRRLERVSRASALIQAQGGTLFLAHVVDAPARLQARLARVLRDSEVAFADSRHSTAVNVRPIASSDPGWDAAVAEGRVRPDLAKRIAGARVDVPPLRERREDLAQLAACLIHKACATERIPLKTIERPALALLTALPWRGNVVELDELLQGLVANVPAPAIRLEDVLAAVRLDGSARAVIPTGTLRDARTRFERDFISAVLRHHRGRIGEAAKTLGIQRTNLYRKMRSLKVNWRGSNGSNGTNGNGAPKATPPDSSVE